MAVALRTLGTARTPDRLLPAVMTRIGLGAAYTTLDTPLGTVYVAFTDDGVSLVRHAVDPTAFEADHRRLTGHAAYRADELPSWLSRGLSGDKAALRFDLHELTPFERAVLFKALEIPRGEVRPYAWIAREIGRPAAVRAVGTALAHNPIPLLIPCHRVVRSDGRIGQYSLGGAEAKRTILAAEGVEPETLEDLARARTRYVGSDSTHIYCYPTCRDARRITERHRVSFHSEAQAAAAGYRPCKTCRPPATVG